MRALFVLVACVGPQRTTAPVEPEPATGKIAVAIIELAGNVEAEDGCRRAVLDAGHRPISKQRLDQVLPNDDDIDYQKLGHALAADLIIDGGLPRGGKLAKAPPPRIVGAQRGDVLAETRVKKRVDESYRNAREICSDLLGQLP